MYNLPTTFFVLCSMTHLIPENVLEKMFNMIQASKGQITQTIHLYSYDPCRLSAYLSDMLIIRPFINFRRRPMQFVRSRNKIFLFADTLKSLNLSIAPHIDCELRKVLRDVTHTIQLSFRNLKFENDRYILNHKHMHTMNFFFQKNFDIIKKSDVIKFSPTLFTALIYAREMNIQPQPRFSDDSFHLKPTSKCNLFMSFTYKCPSCHSDIFDYNSISQKFINKNFDDHERLVSNLVCECLYCIDYTFKNHKFPWSNVGIILCMYNNPIYLQ
jgi:hypothetical protein